MDLDGAHEGVALLLGVVSGGVGEGVGEALLDLGELLVVLGAEGDGEVVGGGDLAAHVHRALVVHLPHEAPAELDGAQRRLERPGEDTLYQPLEATFEALQSHGRRYYPGPPDAMGPSAVALCGRTTTAAVGGRPETGPPSGRYHHVAHSREWRNGRRAGFRCQCP